MHRRLLATSAIVFAFFTVQAPQAHAFGGLIDGVLGGGGGGCEQDNGLLGKVLRMTGAAIGGPFGAAIGNQVGGAVGDVASAAGGEGAGCPIIETEPFKVEGLTEEVLNEEIIQTESLTIPSTFSIDGPMREAIGALTRASMHVNAGSEAFRPAFGSAVSSTDLLDLLSVASIAADEAFLRQRETQTATVAAVLESADRGSEISAASLGATGVLQAQQVGTQAALHLAGESASLANLIAAQGDAEASERDLERMKRESSRRLRLHNLRGFHLLDLEPPALTAEGAGFPEEVPVSMLPGAGS